METSTASQENKEQETRSRSTTSKASSKRSNRRSPRKGLAPRAGAPDLVQISGGAITELDEEASAAQALIDLEIRRSMREARRQQSLQAQQAAAVNATADTASDPAASPKDASSSQPALQADGPEDDAPHHDADDMHEGAVEDADQEAAPEAAITSQTINQHLGLMTQQLTAAHRVIGRVSAERDALRQQVADLQGIPVEEVTIAGLSSSAELDKDRRSSTGAEDESDQKPSRMAKLNYFGAEDIAVQRRRRQTFVLGLLGVLAIAGLYARQIGWSMPEDISRDSLAALPMLGNFMTVFLAGWMLFRVVKVSSRGVRWIFPSEDRRRRRR